MCSQRLLPVGRRPVLWRWFLASRNEGHSRHRLPDLEGFWAVGFADPQHGWLVGTEGRVIKVSFGGDGQSLALAVSLLPRYLP